MIPPRQRIYCSDGLTESLEPHDPIFWNAIDFDTREWILFEGPNEPYGTDMGDTAADVLLPIIDVLKSDTTKITFSADGKHWKATDRPDDDNTPIVPYPRFAKADVGDFAQNTLKRGQWTEVERLGAGLDLINAIGSRSAGKELFVFKYYLVPRPKAVDSFWRTSFYHRALSGHPNIVPFGDFVVDESFERLVGHTTNYIPGGSLDQRRLPLFKKAWVEQLTNLVDLLNLKYGLYHQDINPRNMILDNQNEDQILLFDFEYAALSGSKKIIPLVDEVASVCFTVYELLTGKSFDPRSRTLDLIMESTHQWWVREGMKLEDGVTVEAIKSYLDEWVSSRANSTPPTKFELQHLLSHPDMKIDEFMCTMPNEWDGKIYEAYLVRDTDPDAPIIRWERPSSAQLRLERSPEDPKEGRWSR